MKHARNSMQLCVISYYLQIMIKVSIMQSSITSICYPSRRKRERYMEESAPPLKYLQKYWSDSDPMWHVKIQNCFYICYSGCEAMLKWRLILNSLLFWMSNAFQIRQNNSEIASQNPKQELWKSLNQSTSIKSKISIKTGNNSKKVFLTKHTKTW